VVLRRAPTVTPADQFWNAGPGGPQPDFSPKPAEDVIKARG